ncbi:Predicted kinase, aminoglycoside phosphotransferase (APT) family [Cellulomonas marina]|uniref:Predicted kinase, aminoglycoside phosphotransferase (APT) family n=1 Tax=Cellulomonas marina TaxID=988821 RepID=A0A1I0WBN1_9CELL|nr:Predicted kinase, aminoglycoside phosphotransferase (APT) family [Cellulomonas marina]
MDARRIDAALVGALLREQFPAWASLPVRPVVPGGNDHRTFRLGEHLSVRLPSAPGYVPQVTKEQAWLPVLGPLLPLPVPAVRGVGRPSALFGAPWSVYGWLPGEQAVAAPPDDPVALATELAALLVALGEAPTDGAPPPGEHSAWRGGPLAHWDDEVGDILGRLEGRERDRAAGLWRDALAAPSTVRPRWFHGDVSFHNLLVRDGRLAAVVDFGCSGVGDPACDTVLVWTRLQGAARRAYREGLALDEGTWARGRGWALWKALVMLTNTPPGQAELARHVLDELFAGV